MDLGPRFCGRNEKVSGVSETRADKLDNRYLKAEDDGTGEVSGQASTMTHAI